jgi:Carboxypeptidase regulatory-like domain
MRKMMRATAQPKRSTAMKLITTFAGYLVATTLLFLLGIIGTTWAGGSNDEGPDDHHDDGPSYFGFVKDTSGKVIPDAKVTAEVKGRGLVITRTNATGAYKLPGFGKEVTPKNVSISCSKDGYKQTRAFTRTALNKKPLTAIEIECTMQRVAAK